MRFKTNTIVSTLGLLTLAWLMTACAPGRMVGSCPPLPPPPVAAVHALQAAGSSAVDAWAISLDRHYDKLAACRAL
ncbi:hypothetical protein D9M68_982850 [compost metagenome]